MTIPNFVGQIPSIKAKFNALLSISKTATKDLTQRDKFFMVCTLTAMSPDLASICNQILASPTIPTLQVFSRLFCVTSIPPPRASAGNNSTLVSSHV